MCSASEAFKTEVLKKCLQKNLDQKLKFDRKKKHNVGLKNLNFEFLADGGGFNFFFQTKKFLWFPILENIPCFIFFSKPWYRYIFASEALHIGLIAKSTKNASDSL